jgi:hypothetical protein
MKDNLMQTIRLTAVVDEKRRIMIDLPVGEVEIVVRLHPLKSSEDALLFSMGKGILGESETPNREAFRARLKAIGLLSEAAPPPEALDVDEAELGRLGHVFADERRLSELIEGDREDRL